MVEGTSKRREILGDEKAFGGEEIGGEYFGRAEGG